MADNTTTGTGVPVATRSVTYSGDAAQNVQAVAIVTVAGSDDSKTATDLALGQAAMAASLPVVIASDQTAVPVSLASVPSHAVTNAGTFVVQDNQVLADNAQFTDGTTKVQPVGFIYDEVAGTTLTENDVGAARMDIKRATVSVIEDATTRGRRLAVTSAGAIRVIPGAHSGSLISGLWTNALSTTLTSSSTTEDYSTIAILAFGSSAVGAVTATFEISPDAGADWVSAVADRMVIPEVAAESSVSGSTIGSNVWMWLIDAAGFDKFRVTFSGVLTSGSVNWVAWASTMPRAGRRSVTPISDNAGTITVDAPVATPVFVRLSDGASAITALPVTDNSGSITVDNGGTFVTQAAGTVAHDASTASNPQTIGGRAIAHGANPTAVAAADVTDAYFNRAGVQFTIGGHPNIVTIKHTTITTAVTDAAVVTVAGGLKIVVTSFMFTLDNASTVFPTVLLGFAAANTPTTTGVIGAHGGVPAGGGFGRGDGSGIIGVGADGEDLRVTTTGNATGNGLQLVVTYFTIDS